MSRLVPFVIVHIAPVAVRYTANTVVLYLPIRP